MKKSSTQHAIAAHLIDHSPDVLVVTETWMDKKLPYIHQEYKVLQSPLNKYQGVAIFFKKDIRVSPHLEHTWTPGMVQGKIETEKNTKPIILIGVYIQPATKETCLMQLDQVITAHITDEKHSAIVVAGDMNSSKEELENKLESAKELLIATSVKGTRVQGEKWSKLDYFLSDRVMTNVT